MTNNAIENILLVVGLVMLGVGLWLVYPWLALTVVGALFVLIAVVGPVLRQL